MISHQEGSIHELLKRVQNSRNKAEFGHEYDSNAGKVKSLLSYAVPVYLNDRCLDVLKRFIDDENLQAVAVVDVQHQAVGIIDRGKICDIFLRPFSRDLLGIAMYEVKERGRNHYQMFMPGMENKNQERVSMESHLNNALKNSQFSLCYQPQVDLRQQRMTGVEALLRWQHPQLGYISPSTFISIAEETGLILPIGEWVLMEAIAQHQRWLEQGLPPIRIAVNISAVQFQQDNFADRVRRIIEHSAIDPKYLELELTESAVMQRAEQAARTLMELRELGGEIGDRRFWHRLFQLELFAQVSHRPDQDRPIVCPWHQLHAG